MGENISNAVTTHLNSPDCQNKGTGNLPPSEPVLITDERNENLRFSIQLLNGNIQTLYQCWVITKFGTLESTVAVLVTQIKPKPKQGLIFEIGPLELELDYLNQN